MASGTHSFAGLPFRVLAISQGQWGERIAENIRLRAPADWEVMTWTAPRVLPPVIDDPLGFLPPTLPKADLVLSLGEVSGLAQLIPDIVRKSDAQAVIAPIDRNESLPSGLALQLKGWLNDLGVASVFPRPFCSLTEDSYNRPPLLTHYDNALIQRFARSFGQPQFKVQVEPGFIAKVEVVRDAACGCAHFAAENLAGTPLSEALEKAGMLHHHYPCLASMNKDVDYSDTLMHVSGNHLKDALKREIEAHVPPSYLRPSGLAEQS